MRVRVAVVGLISNTPMKGTSSSIGTTTQGDGNFNQKKMLTSPVAAARAAVATGAWVKSKHDMYLIRGSVGA